MLSASSTVEVLRLARDEIMVLAEEVRELRAALQHEADCVEAAKAEIVTLLARIEAMERQEPVGTLRDDGCFVWSTTRPYESNYAGWKMKLYALPDAKGNKS